jgi:hypothetical protein
VLPPRVSSEAIEIFVTPPEPKAFAVVPAQIAVLTILLPNLSTIAKSSFEKAYATQLNDTISSNTPDTVAFKVPTLSNYFIGDLIHNLDFFEL